MPSLSQVCSLFPCCHHTSVISSGLTHSSPCFFSSSFTPLSELKIKDGGSLAESSLLPSYLRILIRLSNWGYSLPSMGWCAGSMPEHFHGSCCGREFLARRCR